MSAKFRDWRRTLYALKREYGQSLDICRTTNDATNITTGIQRNDEVSVTIKRAVVLPSRNVRAFAYDLAFVAANKNFTYGGFFDHGMRVVVVSRRDVPSSFAVDSNVYVRFKERRFEVKEFHEFEELEAVVFLIDGLAGALPLKDNKVSQGDSLGIVDATDGQKL